MSEQNRRHQQLYFKKFQKWFILSFVLYTAGFLGILSFGIFSWHRVATHQMSEMAGLLSPTFHAQLEASSRNGLIILIAMNLTTIAFAAYQALQFSKKIAGPVYALYRHLDQIAETGEWKPFQLRDGDLFEELPEKLNQAYQLSSTSKRVSETTAEKKAG